MDDEIDFESQYADELELLEGFYIKYNEKFKN